VVDVVVVAFEFVVVVAEEVVVSEPPVPPPVPVLPEVVLPPLLVVEPFPLPFLSSLQATTVHTATSDNMGMKLLE
jgi:hypothetical protein